MSALRYEDVSRMIDHSLLNPILTVAELEAGCLLARRYDVGSVCIMPYQLARCAELLKGSAVTSVPAARTRAKTATAIQLKTKWCGESLIGLLSP